MAEMGKVVRTESVMASATGCRFECLDAQPDRRVLVVEWQGRLPESGMGGGLSSDSNSLERPHRPFFQDGKGKDSKGKDYKGRSEPR